MPSSIGGSATALGLSVSALLIYTGLGAFKDTKGRRRLARWLPVVVIPVAILSALAFARTMTAAEWLLSGVAVIVPFASLISMADKNEHSRITLSQ